MHTVYEVSAHSPVKVRRLRSFASVVVNLFTRDVWGCSRQLSIFQGISELIKFPEIIHFHY